MLHERAHLGGGTTHPSGEALDGGALAQAAAIDIDPVRVANDGIAYQRARGLISVEARDDGLGLPAHEHAAEIENDVADGRCVHGVLIVTGLIR